MPDRIAYVLYGHNNDSYGLQFAVEFRRCSHCGELLERPFFLPNFQLTKKRDVSATYDGYTVVSQRFVDTWRECGGEGLIFIRLPSEIGYFLIDAERVIEFDAERRKTRFEKLKSCCNRYYAVAGATPAFLKHPETLNEREAVKTDLMFGGGDAKHPLIILPIKIGDLMKKAKLSGLDLSDVLA